MPALAPRQSPLRRSPAVSAGASLTLGEFGGSVLSGGSGATSWGAAGSGCSRLARARDPLWWKHEVLKS